MPYDVRKLSVSILTLAALLVAAAFVSAVRPVGSSADVPGTFEVAAGEGFQSIAAHLKTAGLIRSKVVFEISAVLTGQARKLKTGLYSFDPRMNVFEILRALTEGSRRSVAVTIPEGASLYQIDGILSDAGVITRGSLVLYGKTHPDLEGKLFPDTYHFFIGSDLSQVLLKFSGGFVAKAAPLLGGNAERAHELLTIASLIEREVPESHDRRIVAGIIEKRLSADMPLQVDATVCYAKQITAERAVPCYPLSPLDFARPSPYNTYVTSGLPPGPIGNPSVEAISAALHPASSPYWFYLSDPATGKTVFSKTLDEHARNRVKYLNVGA